MKQPFQLQNSLQLKLVQLVRHN